MNITIAAVNEVGEITTMLQNSRYKLMSFSTILLLFQTQNIHMSFVWQSYSGSCYTVPTENPGTFSDKSQECGNIGASLAEIETTEELDFVRDLIDDHGGAPNEYWVGLQGSSDTYHWISSGGEIIPDFWDDGEPNLSGANCIRLRYEYARSAFALADTTCDTHYDAICEKRSSLSAFELSSLHTNKYTRTKTSQITWFLCHVGQASRQSRLQCATWCSTNVTCAGFEFLEVTSTCTLVTLSHACSGDVFTPTQEGYFYLNDDVRSLNGYRCVN